MSDPKSVKLKVENPRIAIVKTLLCHALDRSAILAYAAEKGWHEEPGDIDHYIEIGNSELATAAAEIDTDTELGKAVARLSHLYMQTLKVQDHKTALSIQKEINKVLTLKLAADKLRVPSQHSTPAARPRLKIVGK
jgi:hypothetical protein